MACHIRKDDTVEVITGDHKGQRGKVLRLDPKRGLVVVEGVNLIYRHVRPSRRNPQGKSNGARTAKWPVRGGSAFAAGRC